MHMHQPQVNTGTKLFLQISFSAMCGIQRKISSRATFFNLELCIFPHFHKHCDQTDKFSNHVYPLPLLPPSYVLVRHVMRTLS